jgi:hypothetical protein
MALGLHRRSQSPAADEIAIEFPIGKAHLQLRRRRRAGCIGGQASASRKGVSTIQKKSRPRLSGLKRIDRGFGKYAEHERDKHRRGRPPAVHPSHYFQLGYQGLRWLGLQGTN